MQTKLVKDMKVGDVFVLCGRYVEVEITAARRSQWPDHVQFDTVVVGGANVGHIYEGLHCYGELEIVRQEMLALPPPAVAAIPAPVN